MFWSFRRLRWPLAAVILIFALLVLKWPPLQTQAQEPSRLDEVRAILASPVFAEFDAWAEGQRLRSFSNQEDHEDLGRRIAAERRRVFSRLMELDPKAALERSISEE